MRLIGVIVLAFLFQNCQNNSNTKDTKNTIIDSLKPAPVEPPPMLSTQKTDTLKIVLKSNSVPGDINAATIDQLNAPLKAVAAFYAAMGGTLCDGENCELTTALGLGKQGSAEHKALIEKFFPGDKVAEMVLKQDCYLRPSGASSFSDYEYLTIINLGDTVKVDYSLLYYNQGESIRKKGPDVYLFADNKFTKLERNIWQHAEQ